MTFSGDDNTHQSATTVPDFSHEALAHLQVHSDAFAIHLKNFLDASDDASRSVLVEDLQRFRNTLVLLDKGAAVYVVEELLQLLADDASGAVRNRSELGRVLICAADQLSAHVLQLQRDGSIDNALALLPLVNDSRACRHETLLSDMIILAAGIKMPEPLHASVSDSEWQLQRMDWVEFATAQHTKFAANLLQWWRTNDISHAGIASPQLQKLSEFCQSRKFLHVLVPLFQSAALVAKAVASKEIGDGPAIRKLFAQLERHVHRCMLIAAPEDLLPADLLRNFLYYVGQLETETPVALELRRTFRLDRVRQVASASEFQSTPTIGVGYHLASAIRESVNTETEALKQWLEQAPTRSDHPKVIRLKVRLAQLEPVLTLMGASQALECLRKINDDLKTLGSDTLPEAETRLQLAESLLLLDALLDKEARDTLSGSDAQASSSISAGDVFIDTATDTLLREARSSLQLVAQTLESEFGKGSLATGQCHLLNQQLQLVDNALQILPLPELSPLLTGFANVLNQLQLSGRQENKFEGGDSPIQQEIASLLVSLDYYLGCVLQPQAAASQLLVDAEEALERACVELEDEPAESSSSLSEAEWERRIIGLLPHMDTLGTAIVDYRQTPSETSFLQVAKTLKAFEKQTSTEVGSPIHRLAKTAKSWCDRKKSAALSFNSEDLELLDEVHAVIPQLFDQMLGGSDSVRDFDDLIHRLQTLDDDTGNTSHEVPRDRTLNVDDSLLSSTLDESSSSGFDQTLQHVFYHECLSHLEALDESVRTALNAGEDSSCLLPSEQMLRALHTLTGSAQTVDAPHIVAIVQPLQRAALSRQRTGGYFDADETRFVGDLVVAIRARLESLNDGQEVGKSILAIEQKLGRFLAASIPGADGRDSGLGIASNVRSLDDVFAEEADELLERMRVIVTSANPEDSDVNAALVVLHTLKGSARMAGRSAIAEQAHVLESDVQELRDLGDQIRTLRTGYGDLSRLVSVGDEEQSHTDVSAVSGDAGNVVSSAPVASDSLTVSDIAFDSILDLATDLTVNQARLSDELARLREVYQDIETSSRRFRDLPRTPMSSHNPELNEVLADLEAARIVMRTALRQAEREQQQASRASAGLQQSLIRTRLVRVDELTDRLAMTVSDTAESTDRSARLRMEGGEITLDRSLFRQLLAPLQHLARNAVVHGIEPTPERVKAGKSPYGNLLLSASIDGTDLVLRFSDDGRGIERNDMSRLVEDRGLGTLNSHEDLQNVLFESGFSTVENPTAIAGHGLGLSAVKSAVEYLGGRIQLATDAGVGTCITLRIPQRIVVNQVVLVENEGALFALPVNFVDAVRVAVGSSSKIPEHYSRTPLAALLSQRTSSYNPDKARQKSAVLVTAAGVSTALEIDRVIGYRELVTQALGPQLASLGRYSGGSVLSDGQQVLILDLHRILETFGEEQAPGVKPARESLRPVALIVDDSLTMRVAAESILQQCGIAVRLARDGVEALSSMATALPNLILLDLEMPRLDGRAFLRRIKEEYGDACPPVIIISSRDNRENRQSLLAMGAVRFLAKPYSESQLHEALEVAGIRLPDLTIA